MTKERRLAVLMWREIAERLNEGMDSLLIWSFKKEFCKSFNIHWTNDCYFCNYMTCAVCPISVSEKQGQGCQVGSLHHMALFGSKETSVEAANRIADFLEKNMNEVKK
ncbi:MAG: hypothetical protein HDR52_06175 [Treponema sp.]|nr:hypothetical protein [Treponema sp.]